MIRIVIQQLAIFLLPLLLYVAYLLISRRIGAAGRPRPKWEDGAWYWLIVIGLVLSIAFFVGMGLFGEKSITTPYVPPSGTQ